jgi:LacI family transcriptional regulator
MADPPRAMTGMAEVASRAQVSPATVSRAFNYPELLSRATLARVMAAAAELHYLPDGVARSLRRNRSMVIGAVIPSLKHAYFASTVQALQATLAKQGYTLILATSEFDQSTEFAAVTSMLGQGVDGVVLVGKQHDPRLMELLRERSKPCIVTWSYDPAQPSVGFDHFRAIQPLVHHLLDLGHRDMMAIMAFLKVSDRERERLQGIQHVFAARGLEFPLENVIYAGGSGLQDGRDALRMALERPAVTAVICGNDLLAAGALMECAAQKIGVPEELSIAGYGDLDIAGAMNPAITTVRLDAEEMGGLAASCLLARLAGNEPLDRIELMTQFVVRSSTGLARIRPEGKP